MMPLNEHLLPNVAQAFVHKHIQRQKFIEVSAQFYFLIFSKK